MRAYLKELGATQDQIDYYENVYRENLSSNLLINKTNFFYNMKFLLSYFDLDLLLMMVIYYEDAFTMNFDEFINRFSILKNEIPNLIAIIESQFHGISNKYHYKVNREDKILYLPIMSVIPYFNFYENVDSIIDSYKHPKKRFYNFIFMLKELGLEIDVDDLSEECLFEYEERIDEIYDIVTELMALSVSEDVIVELITYNFILEIDDFSTILADLDIGG